MQTTNHKKNAVIGPGNTSTTTDFRVSQLTTGAERPRWSIAVFAHNEAKTIRAALQSIVVAAGDHAVSVYVLANGCTDATVDEVRACAAFLANLSLVEIRKADKANAWNTFIHGLISDEQACDIETCFFMDGDVTLTPDAMSRLASSLDETPDAEAAGGMPGSGRDMDAWRQRMVVNRMLAGNFYALRGRFVQQLRQSRIRMPVGLIGEDFLVSWLVANTAWRNTKHPHRSRSVFNASAEFSFRSLSFWRPADYRTYLHRKWRYTLRGIQHQMLIMLLTVEGVSSMPASIGELYLRGPLPSRFQWAGITQTTLHLLAMLRIRSFRRAAGLDN